MAHFQEYFFVVFPKIVMKTRNLSWVENLRRLRPSVLFLLIYTSWRQAKAEQMLPIVASFI